MYLQLALPVFVLLFNKGQYLLAKGLWALQIPRLRLLRALSLAPANEEELLHLKHRLNMKVLSFVNLVYMTLVRYVCGAFICSEVAPNVFALDLSPPNQCYTPEHIWVMALAIVALVVYVAGFPLYVIRTLMLIDQKQLHSDQRPRALAKYRAFYAKYEPHALRRLSKHPNNAITPRVICMDSYLRACGGPKFQEVGAYSMGRRP